MMCDKLFTINMLLNAKQIPIIRGKGEAFNRLHVLMLVLISQFPTRLSPPHHPQRICQQVIWSKKEFWKLNRVASEKCMAQLIASSH